MTHDEVIALIVMLIISGILIVLGIILMHGKGAFLIAGYNTASEAEKKKYNEKLLCRCVGIIVIVVAGLLPVGIIADIFQMRWMYFFVFLAIFIIVITAVIYINLSGKYKQQ